MDKFSFKDIDIARRLLGLSTEATLKEIKEAYRNKARQFHPDKYVEGEKGIYEKKMARVNRAYKILLKYVEEYRFPFKKEDVDRNNPERDLIRFYEDWLGK